MLGCYGLGVILYVTQQIAISKHCKVLKRIVYLLEYFSVFLYKFNFRTSSIYKIYENSGIYQKKNGFQTNFWRQNSLALGKRVLLKK